MNEKLTVEQSRDFLRTLVMLYADQYGYEDWEITFTDKKRKETTKEPT